MKMIINDFGKYPTWNNKYNKLTQNDIPKWQNGHNIKTYYFADIGLSDVFMNPKDCAKD